MRRLKVAICYEPPHADSTADLQDVETQAAFLKDHIPHNISLLPYSGNIADFISSLRETDLAWNLFETFNGAEELQYMGAALLELSGAAYTGTKLAGLVAAADKRQVKALLADAGVPVPETYKQGKFKAGKWIVKPSKLHGSVGIDKNSVIDAREEHQLNSAIDARPELELFAEAYLDGEEYAAALLDTGSGLETIAVARMQFLDFPETNRILSFDAKWQEESKAYKQTVRSFRIDDAMKTKIAALANQAAKTAGLAGFARIDFRTAQDGKAYVIDVNPNPGLGSDSGFIAACLQAGISAGNVLDYIIQAALR